MFTLLQTDEPGLYMLARRMTAVLACLFLLSISQIAFSQSNYSSDENETESSSKDTKKDDKSETGDEDKEAQKEDQRRQDTSKKDRKSTILSDSNLGVRSRSQNDVLKSGSGSGTDAFARSGCSECMIKEPIRVRVEQLELGGDGTLDQKRVKRVTKRGVSAVTRCLARVFEKAEATEGRLFIALTIGEGGRVTEVGVPQSDFDAAADTCVTSTAKRWRFPRPEGGKVIAGMRWTVSLEDKD